MTGTVWALAIMIGLLSANPALGQTVYLVNAGGQSLSAIDPQVEVPATPSTAFTSEALVARFTGSGRPDKSFGSGKGFVRDSFGLISPLSAESRLVAAMAGTVDSIARY